MFVFAPLIMCDSFEYTEGSLFDESTCQHVSGDGKQEIIAVTVLAQEAHFLFAKIGGVHAVSRGGVPCEFVQRKLLATLPSAPEHYMHT